MYIKCNTEGLHYLTKGKIYRVVGGDCIPNLYQIDNDEYFSATYEKKYFDVCSEYEITHSEMYRIINCDGFEYKVLESLFSPKWEEMEKAITYWKEHGYPHAYFVQDISLYKDGKEIG